MPSSVAANSEHQLDVVFVHGLGGDRDTWLNKRTNFNWPDEMAMLDRRLRVVNLQYRAPMFRFQDASAVNVQFQSIALSFLNALKNEHVGNRPTAFIVHSLGGIVVKEALRAAVHHDQYRSIVANSRCVVFLATPHCGSGVANAGAYLSPGISTLGKIASFAYGLKLLTPVGVLVRLVVEALAGIARTSSLTSQLKNHEAPLMSLMGWYRSWAQANEILTYSFYETEKAFRCVHVVDPCSAEPGIVGVSAERAEQKDHFSIAKPANSDDELFKTVKRIVEEVRATSRVGKDYPVFRGAIAEALEDKTLQKYKDVGNFAEVPPEAVSPAGRTFPRMAVEERLRTQFRNRIKGIPVTAVEEQAATKSSFDIDKFLLALWYQKSVTADLESLVTFIKDEDAKVRAHIHDEPAPTLILLYRAVRTLDHVLTAVDYAGLVALLTRSLGTIQERFTAEIPKAELGFDAKETTQKELAFTASLAKTLCDFKTNASP
jgi:pimeloyl-ACP methyl ester carboxylesterase